MVVDGVWSHVGSTNLDARSLEMSEEVSAGILDAPTADALRASFRQDVASSREITRADWADRSAWHRLKDRLAHLANDQL
jgi:cardiolipin synthase